MMRFAAWSPQPWPMSRFRDDIDRVEIGHQFQTALKAFLNWSCSYTTFAIASLHLPALMLNAYKSASNERSPNKLFAMHSVVHCKGKGHYTILALRLTRYDTGRSHWFGLPRASRTSRHVSLFCLYGSNGDAALHMPYSDIAFELHSVVFRGFSQRPQDQPLIISAYHIRSPAL